IALPALTGKLLEDRPRAVRVCQMAWGSIDLASSALSETYTPRLIMNSWGQLTLAASTASWNRYQLLMTRSILLAVPPVMTLIPRSRDQAIVGTLDVARQNCGWGLVIGRGRVVVSGRCQYWPRWLTFSVLSSFVMSSRASSNMARFSVRFTPKRWNSYC